MRGHIERRGPRSWRLKWDIGADPGSGARQIRRKTVNGTKKAAEAELARILAAIETGAYVDPHRMSVGELLERWRDDVAAVEVSAKTLERYHEHVARLIEGLGTIPLLKLRALDEQAFYRVLRATGNRRTGRGLSEQTLLHVHKVLGAALAQGVRWRLMAYNPAQDVRSPVPRRLEMATLQAAEITALVATTAGTALGAAVLLLFTTGLRRGELLALRWSDLDRERGRLVVSRTLEETRAGLTFKPPKTARSTRVVPLPPSALAALSTQALQQRRQRLQAGPSWQDQGLIFPGAGGDPLAPSYFSKAFAAAVRRAGLRAFGAHALRHTHVTELLRAGVHPKVVSERVGHSSVSFTMQRYAHALPDMQQNAADEMERLVGRLGQR